MSCSGSRTQYCIQSILITECVSPQLSLDSQNVSGALKRMRRAREDGRLHLTFPDIPDELRAPGPTDATGWPKAAVQKERTKKGEEGKGIGEGYEGKLRQRGGTLGIRYTARRGHVAQYPCFTDKERSSREVK